jgi:cytochrome c peroxidase
MWLLLLGCAEPPQAVPVVDFPAHFPEPVIPQDNPLTAEKIALGRLLFYDVRLSVNGLRSCGICHEQAIGFTDGFVQAVGATNEKHSRNTLSLLNVAWRAPLTWRDPSVASLEAQLVTPLMGTDPVEMGMTEALLVERLSETTLYPSRFTAAFPEDAEPIRLENVAKALASFQRTLFGGDSSYDRHLAGAPDALSPAAARGMALFFGDALKCSRCHGGVFFDQPTDDAGALLDEPAYFNTGLYNIDGAGGYPPDETGLHAETGRPEDMGRFRVPSLRGVTASGPWTHDGTVLFLPDLLDAYARGGRLIQSGPYPGDGAENPYKSPMLAGFTMTDADRDDLLAFLDALSDTTALSRPSLATPFCTDGDSGEHLSEPCIPPATGIE